MELFAIQRVSDGKFLLRQTLKGIALVTWMSFDEGYAPHLYTHRQTAEKGMKLWKRGGWKRGPGGIKLVPGTERSDQVRVVPIQFLIVEAEPTKEETSHPALSALT